MKTEKLEFYRRMAEHARTQEAKESIRRFKEAKERLERKFVAETTEVERLLMVIEGM